jgi:hypothetical protein
MRAFSTFAGLMLVVAGMVYAAQLAPEGASERPSVPASAEAPEVPADGTCLPSVADSAVSDMGDFDQTEEAGDPAPAGGVCVSDTQCSIGGPHCSASQSCTGPHDTGLSSCNGVTCFAPYSVHYYTCACMSSEKGMICPASENKRFQCL